MRTTSGLFNFIKKDDIMELKQHQPPMNIDNQIANLKALGLEIKNEEKAKCFLIANTFGIGYTYLESWFEHLSFIRNICAHYGRLYNATFPKTPTLYKQYSKQNIGNRRIYATLICIKHLSPNDRHWNEFIETISLLIEKYSNINIEYMGFPENWKEILSEN